MLSVEQKKILRRMILAMLISLATVLFVWVFPFNWRLNRLSCYFLALVLPTFSYIIGIGRIASLRFFDDSVSNPLLATKNAQLDILKQYLSNTHEQLFLAVIVYALLSWYLPLEHIYLVLLLSCCFTIGRVFFASGYSQGAHGRSLGFALTFYSTIVGFITSLIYLFRSFS